MSSLPFNSEQMPDSTRALSVRSPGEPEATSFGELVWGTANECGLRIPAEVSLFWRQTLFASFQAELVESTSVANSAPDGTEPDNSSRPVSSTLCCDDVFPHQAVNSTPELSGGGNSPLLPVRNQRDGGAPLIGIGNSPFSRITCNQQADQLYEPKRGNSPSSTPSNQLGADPSLFAKPLLAVSTGLHRDLALPPIGDVNIMLDYGGESPLVSALGRDGLRAGRCRTGESPPVSALGRDGFRAGCCRAASTAATSLSTLSRPDRGLPSVIEPVSATPTSASVVQSLPEWWPYRHSQARNATQVDVEIAAGDASARNIDRDDGMAKAGAPPDCRDQPHPRVSPASNHWALSEAQLATLQRRSRWSFWNKEITLVSPDGRNRSYVSEGAHVSDLNRDSDIAAPALGKRAHNKTLYM